MRTKESTQYRTWIKYSFHDFLLFSPYNVQERTKRTRAYPACSWFTSFTHLFLYWKIMYTMMALPTNSRAIRTVGKTMSVRSREKMRLDPATCGFPSFVSTVHRLGLRLRAWHSELWTDGDQSIEVCRSRVCFRVDCPLIEGISIAINREIVFRCSKSLLWRRKKWTKGATWKSMQNKSLTNDSAWEVFFNYFQ